MGAWGRDLCRGTCQDGSSCRNLVPDGQLYCRHHKDQMTEDDRKDLQRQNTKDSVIAVIGLVLLTALVLLAALG
jgi:hypothetical protein